MDAPLKPTTYPDPNVPAMGIAIEQVGADLPPMADVIAAGPPPMLSVVAPAGVLPGAQFVINAPNGEQLVVTMPADTAPGFPFNVVVPPHVLQAAPNAYDIPVAAGFPVLSPPPGLSAAPMPTPTEMQRLVSARHTQQPTRAYPPMQPSNCTCIGVYEPKGRWRLPPRFKTCGCITTQKMDLREMQFPQEGLSSFQHCAWINTNEFIAPPEVQVAGGPCGCISDTQSKDRRPKEARGSSASPHSVVRVGGCACINATKVTVLDHGQPMPKNCVVM